MCSRDALLPAARQQVSRLLSKGARELACCWAVRSNSTVLVHVFGRATSPPRGRFKHLPVLRTSDASLEKAAQGTNVTRKSSLLYFHIGNE